MSELPTILSPEDLAARVAAVLGAGTRLAYAEVAADLRILQVSENFADVMGDPEGPPASGTPVTDVIWELVGAEESLKLVQTGELEHYSLERVNRSQLDGSLSYLNFAVVRLAPADEAGGLLILVEDDTAAGVLEQRLVQDRNELRLTRAALEQANAELARLDRLKSLFLSIVVHDLRSPLTAMYGYTELVRASLAAAGSHENAEYLSVVSSQVQWLNRLASDLLDLDRLEQGALTVDRKVCDLRALVSSVTEPLSEGMRVRGLTLSVELPQSEVSVYADADRVQQILYNLLGNAAKYTEEAGAVRVKTWQEEGFGAFSIWNSGPGLSPEEQSNLFRLYYRTDEARQSATQGSGLGLFIVKSLVDAHDGQIEVRSEPGSGTEFIVRFPAHGKED